MGDPFLSGLTFVSPSLNRVRVQTLPGAHFPNDWCGLSGFDLLSAASLQGMIEERAAELRLTGDRSNLLHAFDACFNSPILHIRAAARQIAEEYGRRLALLLLTLKRAEPENRLARPSWGDKQWNFWRNTSTVHIGGGLLSGAMGPFAIAAAQDGLQSCGFSEMSVQLSSYAAYLPLAGLARKAPPQAQAMLTLDFGHSDVKRAAAFYVAGKISELRLLPKVSLPSVSQLSALSEREQAAEVVDIMVKALARSWQEAVNQNWPLDPVVGLSLACYLINGQPPTSEMGTYGRVQLLTDNMQTYLATRVSEDIEQKLQIILVHDGSAAGLVFAGSPQTVVLTLGTYIGVGFPPDSDQGLRQSVIEQRDWHRALYSTQN